MNEREEDRKIGWSLTIEISLEGPENRWKSHVVNLSSYIKYTEMLDRTRVDDNVN